MKQYLNDALIGNKELKVSITDKGEMIRICYPNVDYRQFIDFLHMGVKINDSNLIYLHNDSNNIYMQKYVEDTNILKTEVKNTYFNLKMGQTDFVCTSRNAIIRKYTFTNEHDIELNLKFICHSKLLTDDNNFVGARVIENGILQYSHGYNFGIISNDLKLNSHKINGTDEVINSGILYDKDYIGMSNNSAISFDIGTLKPNEKKEFSIIIFITENKEKRKSIDIEETIEEIKKINVKNELKNANQYWKKYVKTHMVHNIGDESIYKEKINNIYKRTILLYPLLMNHRYRWNICCNGNR